MKSRFAGFVLLVGLTLYVAFFVWNVAQMSYIPIAAQEAYNRGERLPAYQILGVDLASYRLAWFFWSTVVVGAYWRLKKKNRERSVGLVLYCAFAAPLVATSSLLIAPLLS